jgi:glycine oxidase
MAGDRFHVQHRFQKALFVMDDCLIIGGGVVGLSIAYELAGRGKRVTVVDRSEPGREASWAGAGILPAAVERAEDAAYHQLSGLSVRLHAQWAERLRDATGIDTGYRECGELNLASGDRTHSGPASDVDPLSADVSALRSRGIQVEDVTSSLNKFEPGLSWTGPPADRKTAWFIPRSAQLRNPRHLKALMTICRSRKVNLIGGTEVRGIEHKNGRVVQVGTSAGTFRANQYCVCAGAWAGEVMKEFNCRLPIKPIRGQIALLKTDAPVIRRVVHEGRHYLVPRDDGRVLVGSTLEDVGFDKRTTTSAIQSLLDFAISRVPALQGADVERCWAGLRPGSPAGQPFMGRIPDFANAFAAVGHFRWGLYLSPGTATVMGQLLCGETPQIDLSEFRLDRQF